MPSWYTCTVRVEVSANKIKRVGSWWLLWTVWTYWRVSWRNKRCKWWFRSNTDRRPGAIWSPGRSRPTRHWKIPRIFSFHNRFFWRFVCNIRKAVISTFFPTAVFASVDSYWAVVLTVAVFIAPHVRIIIFLIIVVTIDVVKCHHKKCRGDNEAPQTPLHIWNFRFTVWMLTLAYLLELTCHGCPDGSTKRFSVELSSQRRQ